MEKLVETLEKETQIPTADTAFTQPQKLPFTVMLDKPAGTATTSTHAFSITILQSNSMQRGLTKQMKKSWKTFSNAGTGNGHAKERGFQTKSASKQFIKYHS